MGNIVDGIQRPLRVCSLLISQSVRDQDPVVYPRTFKVYLYSPGHQHGGLRPQRQVGFHTNGYQGMCFPPCFSHLLSTHSLATARGSCLWRRHIRQSLREFARRCAQDHAES